MMPGRVLEFREDEILRLLRTRVRFMQAFLVRSADDSMILTEIRQGDVVRVVRRDNFKDGDIVLLKTPDGIFFRFLYRLGNGRILSVGAHPDCPECRYELKRVHILGIVESEASEV